MDTEKYLKSLIGRNGGEVMPFRNLPIPAQAAMAWYMSLDGVAWKQAPGLPKHIRGLNEHVVKALPWYRKHYGSQRFGYVEIPTEEMLEAIWDLTEDDWKAQHGDVISWHEWFMDRVGTAGHGRHDRWPVILSSVNMPIGGVIQDGWHRLNDYISQGARVIPALYYPW